MNEKPITERPIMTEVLPKTMATPVAYLENAGQKNIIVKLEGTNDYALLEGPEYALTGAMRGDWVLAATVAKYGFLEYEEPQKPMQLESPTENDKK